LFLQLSSLEADYARVKSQAVQIFHRVAPEETDVVDPAAQLRQKLDSFHKESEVFACFSPDRKAPLEILQALSQRTPARGSLRLHDVLITGGSVRIMGSCDSFATLSEWQRLLATTPGLQVVNVPNPKKHTDGKVLFTISLSSTRSKAS
jgi:Tfp pilus assembly protein PilN